MVVVVVVVMVVLLSLALLLVDVDIDVLSSLYTLRVARFVSCRAGSRRGAGI